MGTLRAGPGHKRGWTKSQVRVRVGTYVRCGYICNRQKNKNLLHTKFFLERGAFGKFSCKLLLNKLTQDDDSRRSKGLNEYCGDIVQQHQLKLI